MDGKSFVKFAVIKPGLSLQAGAGVNAVFHITYIAGKFRIFCKAALCWGVGAKGALGIEVNIKEIGTFFEAFVIMLRNCDYQKMADLASDDAFKSLTILPILALSAGVQSGELMYKTIGKLVDEFPSADQLLNDLSGVIEAAERRRNLMNSINANPDLLKFTTPETKGTIIATLIENNFIDRVDWRNDNLDASTLNFYKVGVMKLRKQAVFNSLKWIQSKKDYENVMQHLSLSPGSVTGSWETNQDRVITFLAEGEHSWMGIFSTQYAEKLLWLYERLPDGSSINPNDPLVPIPQDYMDQYLALIDEQDSVSENGKMTA
ncbi:hypothetical protein ABRZ24_22265 [Brenneria populi]|uniref:Uncharacterized protein n=1 Tax=Brenneria populi TaxID=1505588 RepID=A0ABU6JXF6_9GAMM|nr:hypothetical protein [Brenneria populi Li et al. 2015]